MLHIDDHAFFLILYYPQLEAPIYYWQAAAGFPIIINHRTFLGISMFVMYLNHTLLLFL